MLLAALVTNKYHLPLSKTPAKSLGPANEKLGLPKSTAVGVNCILFPISKRTKVLEPVFTQYAVQIPASLATKTPLG